MTPYWNWSSHKLLLSIIKIIKSQQAKKWLEIFESKINYQLKLKDVHEHLRKYKVPRSKGYCRMVATINKKYTDITLKKGLDIEELVSEFLDQCQPSDSTYTESQRTQMVWQVPIAAVSSLQSKVFQQRNSFIKESILRFEIGEVVVYDANLPVPEVSKMCLNVYA